MPGGMEAVSAEGSDHGDISLVCRFFNTVDSDLNASVKHENYLGKLMYPFDTFVFSVMKGAFDRAVAAEILKLYVHNAQPRGFIIV